MEENHKPWLSLCPPDMDVFKGHFPSHPVLPGVLILEMLAQTGAIAVLVNPSNRNRIAYLSIDRARFKRPVMPGETMRRLSWTNEKF